MESIIEAAPITVRTSATLARARGRTMLDGAFRGYAKNAGGYAVSVLVAVLVLTVVLTAALNIALMVSGAASVVLAFQLAVACVAAVGLSVVMGAALAR